MFGAVLDGFVDSALQFARLAAQHQAARESKHCRFRSGLARFDMKVHRGLHSQPGCDGFRPRARVPKWRWSDPFSGCGDGRTEVVWSQRKTDKIVRVFAWKTKQI